MESNNTKLPSLLSKGATPATNDQSNVSGFGGMQRTNSIQQFLNFSGTANSNNYMSNTFNGMSLISPVYGLQNPTPQQPKREQAFNSAFELKKSPSLIKNDSRSDFSPKDTPLPLPMDTPAAPKKPEVSPLLATNSMYNSTPASNQMMSVRQDNRSQMLPPQAQGRNVGEYTKTLMDAGLDASELQRYPVAEQVGARKADAEPTLQNIVSTVDLKCKLDLKTIALNARNTEYNPKRFAAAIMKIRNPKTTALIFSSGKMVCTGAKSEEDSKKAAKKYAKTIKNMGFDVRFTDFKVQNIVASADVGFAIRLESLSHRHSEFCQYEPEIFPGLIYRIYQPKVVVLIFVSGKIVLTGAKTREQIKEAYNNILPALQMHKKEETTASSRSSVQSIS